MLSKSGDNLSYDCTPFKGPFKGKGANRQARRQIEREFKEIVDAMERLVDEFNNVFPSTPRPVNLRIHRRSHHHPLLSWRYAKHSGSYLKLFGSDEGRVILDRLGPQARKLFARFDRERLRMNFRCKVLWNVKDAYALYEAGLEDQKTYRALASTA